MSDYQPKPILRNFSSKINPLDAQEMIGFIREAARRAGDSYDMCNTPFETKQARQDALDAIQAADGVLTQLLKLTWEDVFETHIDPAVDRRI